MGVDRRAVRVAPVGLFHVAAPFADGAALLAWFLVPVLQMVFAPNGLTHPGPGHLGAQLRYLTVRWVVPVEDGAKLARELQEVAGDRVDAAEVGPDGVTAPAEGVPPGRVARVATPAAPRVRARVGALERSARVGHDGQDGGDPLGVLDGVGSCRTERLGNQSGRAGPGRRLSSRCRTQNAPISVGSATRLRPSSGVGWPVGRRVGRRAVTPCG